MITVHRLRSAFPSSWWPRSSPSTTGWPWWPPSRSWPCSRTGCSSSTTKGAHRLLFSHRFWNDLIGITLFGWIAFGTGTHSYRRAHTRHHRDEFGPKEPDFLLYSFYPIPASSMRRKLFRDLTGVSAYRILKPRLTGLATRRYRVNSLRFFAGQAVIVALFVAAGAPLALPSSPGSCPTPPSTRYSTDSGRWPSTVA